MLVHQLTKAKQSLDRVSIYQGLDFAYAVMKNKQLIDNKLMEVDFIRNVSPQVLEYEEKRVKLCEEYAQKDENGRPIIEKDLYVIMEQDREIFRGKMEELFEQYRPFIEERRQQVDLFTQKMNSPVDFEFIKIEKKDIPPQISTAQELEDIAFMIE